MVTKEQVQEQAVKLGLTLTEEQITAYALIGRLPEKEVSGSASGGDDDDDDSGDGDKDLGEGAKKRIKKLSDRAKATAKELEEARKKILEFEKFQQDQNQKKAADKGEWEKLKKEAEEAKLAAENAKKSLMDKHRENATLTALREALRDAGCPKERIAKAVKLFDTAKIDFTWTDEGSFQYDIEDFSSEVEEFKKENDFLFGDSREEPPSGYQGSRPPKKAGGGNQNDRMQKLRSQFSALR